MLNYCSDFLIRLEFFFGFLISMDIVSFELLVAFDSHVVGGDTIVVSSLDKLVLLTLLLRGSRGCAIC